MKNIECSLRFPTEVLEKYRRKLIKKAIDNYSLSLEKLESTEISNKKMQKIEYYEELSYDLLAYLFLDYSFEQFDNVSVWSGYSDQQ